MNGKRVCLRKAAILTEICFSLSSQYVLLHLTGSLTFVLVLLNGALMDGRELDVRLDRFA